MNQKQEIKQKKILVKANDDYRKNLNSYAFFRLKNKAISEDLVQDTFKKTWSYLVRGGKVNIMKSFLYHVLRGLIIDEYRKKKTISLEDLAKKGFELSEDNSEKMINILDGEQAIFLISKLPMKYQEIIRLRYIKELSLEEISTITGISKKTLSVQIHRGLIKLKKIYNRDD